MDIIDFEKQLHLQPNINIGMIGSVSNGKSSIVERLTNIKTQKHSSETKRNITIKLGYANAKIFKCNVCSPPDCYQSRHSSEMEANCDICNGKMELKKHISIIDVPGHNLLMATMLNGTCVMDCTILVEAANINQFPAPQTKEHLLATKMINLKNDIVCVNKLDLIKKSVAVEKINLIKESLKGTMAESSLIIPIAANYGININILCEYICNYMDHPIRNISSYVNMIIIRSFNVNKQDTDISKLEGGVIGGTITKGILNVGDKVIIYPGIININKNNNTKWEYKPIVSTVESIYTENINLERATPGGLIGVKLNFDPALAAKDGLVGNVLTIFGNNEHQIYEVIFVELELLNRDDGKNEKISDGDKLIINANACNSKCEIVKIRKNKAEIKLIDKPIAVINGDYVTLSKSINNNILIVGRAKILDGVCSTKAL